MVDKGTAGLRRTDRQLQAERNFTSAVLDTTAALVMVLDREGRIVRFNRACERATGYAAEQVRGEYLWDLFLPPDEMEGVKAVFDELTAGEFPLEYENHWLTKDGERRLMAWSNTALVDDEGAVEYVVATGIDITEQRRAEEALYRARDELEKRVQERTAQLRHRVAFEDLITTISTRFIDLSAEEIDAGINRALGDVGQFMNVDRSYVFLFSADRKTMDNTHEWCAEGIPCQMEHMQNVSVDNLSWSNDILLRGEILDIPCVADLPPEAEAERAEFTSQDIRSLLAVPMIYRGRTRGFVGFDAVRAERRWPMESFRLLRTLAAVFATALERKRAHAIQVGQRQFLELLATGGGFSETLQTLVELIEEQWPGMLGLVLLLDEDGKHLHVGASVSLPQDYVKSIEGLEIGPRVGSCGTACYMGERVIVEDIARDSRWEGLRSLALGHGLRACWSEPVFSAEGEVLGTFAMYYRHPRAPTDAELRTIEIGAHLVGIAVERKRAREALQAAYETLERRVEERTRELFTLLDTSHNVASTLELDPLLDLTLEQLGSVMDYDAASIMILEDDTLEIAAYRGPISHEKVLDFRFSTDEAAANREVIRRREPLIIGDIRAETPLAAAFRETAGDELDGAYGYIRCWMGVPLIVKDRVVGMLTLDHSQPNHYTSQDAKLVMAFADQVAVAIENAQLYEQEQERLEESERRRQVAEGLRGVLATLNSDLPLDEILDHIIDQACRLLGSEAGVAYQLLLEDDLIKVEAICDMPGRFRDIGSLPLIETEPNQAILDGRPFAVSDLQARLADVDGDALLEIPSVRAWRAIVGEHFRSYLSVPILIQDQVYGAISLFYAQSREFSNEEIDLAVTFADQAALAIHNAQLRIEAQKSAAAAERSRLARDLHDAVTQTLFSASLIAEVLPRIWERDPQTGRSRLEELRELTRGALAEMRTLLLELRPSSLEDAALHDLLRQLGESITGRARVPVTVEVEGECALPSPVKVAFYRVAQEALNNVAKHANASQAEIYLRCRQDAVELCVCDDGKGFDPDDVSPDSLGLGIMRERAQEIEARLIIESERGQGTIVRVVWSRKGKKDTGAA